MREGRIPDYAEKSDDAMRLKMQHSEARNSSPDRDSNPPSRIGDRRFHGYQMRKPFHHALPRVPVPWHSCQLVILMIFVLNWLVSSCIYHFDRHL